MKFSGICGMPEFNIEPVTVTIKAKKKLSKAEYTLDIADTLWIDHDLDVEAELSNILSSEIVKEIDREAKRIINAWADRINAECPMNQQKKMDEVLWEIWNG